MQPFYSFLIMHVFLSSQNLGNWPPLVNLTYIFFSYTALGGLYEGRHYGAVLEIIRLLAFFGLAYVHPVFGSATTLKVVSWVNLLNVSLWPAVAIFTFRRAENSKKHKKTSEANKAKVN